MPSAPKTPRDVVKRRYLVRFFKTVSTDFGAEHEITQGAIEVFATGEADAIEQGKAEFCRKRRVRDWTQHADRCVAEPSEFPA